MNGCKAGVMAGPSTDCQLNHANKVCVFAGYCYGATSNSCPSTERIDVKVSHEIE